MQTINTIERMLESADHHYEQHRGGSTIPGSVVQTPHLPEGWILYSAYRVLEGAKKGWNVSLMNAVRPFHKGSMIEVRHQGSLDAALREASTKIRASRSAA